MINGITLSALRHNDVSQYMNNVVTLVGQYDPAALMVQDEYTVLQTNAASFQRLLNAMQGNTITAELEQLDLQRDNAINGIIFTVTGATYSSNPATKAFGYLLQTHLSAFGPTISRESYQNETNKIQNIVADWNDKPDLKAAVTGLGLDAWKADLETANNAFDARYVARSIDKGTSTMDNVKTKRAELNQMYYDLRDALDARYTINKKTQPEPFLSAIKAFNGLVKDYNDLLARKGYSNGEEAIPPVDPTPVVG